MALKHLQTPPPLITEFNPSIPTQLEQIINKILSKEPSGRYRTAGQLGRILSTYRERSQQDTGAVQPLADDPEVPIYEQKTQIYQRSAADERTKLTEHTPTASATVRRPISDGNTRTVYIPIPRTPANETDWTAVGLGITALIALLGLIPLWYFVYRAWIG
jgi:serine/threonine-protein kinase